MIDVILVTKITCQLHDFSCFRWRKRSKDYVRFSMQRSRNSYYLSSKELLPLGLQTWTADSIPLFCRINLRNFVCFHHFVTWNSKFKNRSVANALFLSIYFGTLYTACGAIIYQLANLIIRNRKMLSTEWVHLNNNVLRNMIGCNIIAIILAEVEMLDLQSLVLPLGLRIQSFWQAFECDDISLFCTHSIAYCFENCCFPEATL